MKLLIKVYDFCPGGFWVGNVLSGNENKFVANRTILLFFT